MRGVRAWLSREPVGPERYARPDAAPNLFFVCTRARFLFGSIAKNACTTLKHLCYELDAGAPFAGDDPDAIHDALGYAPVPGRVVDRGDRAQLAGFAGYTRFAVYRDPVERLLSAWADKTRPAARRHAFFDAHGLIGLPLDPFLDAVEEILALADPLAIDEHLRPQHLCFAREDLDFVVPIEALSSFVAERFGVALARRHNAAAARPEASAPQRARIRALYARDCEIVPNYTAEARRA